MKIIKAADYNEMSKKAAAIIASQITLKPDSVLGLATGSSPVGLYKNLVQWYNEGLLDFSQIKTVNLDEYHGLDHTNEQSYFYFMQDNLFSHVNINMENVNLPDGTAEDGDKECARYNAVIQSMGGVDLQLLGLGHDGHIGFNEPGPIFTKGVQRAKLAETTIQANKRFFESEDQVPRYAFSMGIGNIMAAKKILVIVSGAEKAKILKEVLTGDITPEVPGSILQYHPDVTFVCDADALSLME